MTYGVDYSGTGNSDWIGLAKALAANGKFIAGRYAVYDKSPGGRGITGSEYTALMAHGIDVFLYYEETETWMLGGFSAGVRAANAAMDVIRTERMPENLAVYYGHDVDPTPDQFAAIDDCLRGAASVVGIARVGFYGGWLGIDHCAAAGTATWFTQTLAWEYGRGIHPAAHLYQYDIFGPTIYGTPCDLVRSVKSHYGGAREALGPGPIVPTPTTTTTSAPVPPPPRPPNAGRYKLRPQMYLSNQDAKIGGEITELVSGGEVTVDATAEVPMTLSATLLDPSVVEPFSWVRPFLTISWYDPIGGGKASITEPLGCFQAMPVAAHHTAAMGTGTLDGRDGCWLLKQGGLGGNKTYAAGLNVVDAIVDLVAGAGFSKVHIPGKANTFASKRHYAAGTPTLDVVNDLLMRIGYYPLWFDRDGVARSMRIQPRWKVQARRTISSANGDVVGVVDLETDPERICNRAVCIVNDPKRTSPIVVTKSNHRADSPVSIENLGFVRAKVIKGMNVDSTAEATDLVNQALEDGASVETRVNLAILPDPAFAMHKVLWLDVARDDGEDVLSGTWYWTNLTIGFSPSQMPMTLTLNKLIPWSDD